MRILSGNVSFEQSSQLDSSIQNVTFSHLLNEVLPTSEEPTVLSFESSTYKKDRIKRSFFIFKRITNFIRLANLRTLIGKLIFLNKKAIIVEKLF